MNWAVGATNPAAFLLFSPLFKKDFYLSQTAENHPPNPKIVTYHYSTYYLNLT
jgi:hypothetical protein